MIFGRVTVAEAKACVGLPGATASDGARYTTVGALRAAGFVVKRSPTRRNEKHVSVLLPGQVWGDDHAARFNECFIEPPTWHGSE